MTTYRIGDTLPETENPYDAPESIAEEIAYHLREAAMEYIDRQSRHSHPLGHSDNGGRWYPNDVESCVCCKRVREPSRAYPWSLMTHCRTIGHIAHLYGVDVSELRKRVNAMRKSMAAATLEN